MLKRVLFTKKNLICFVTIHIYFWLKLRLLVGDENKELPIWKTLANFIKTLPKTPLCKGKSNLFK